MLRYTYEEGTRDLGKRKSPFRIPPHTVATVEVKRRKGETFILSPLVSRSSSALARASKQILIAVLRQRNHGNKETNLRFLFQAIRDLTEVIFRSWKDRHRQKFVYVNEGFCGRAFSFKREAALLRASLIFGAIRESE